MESWKESPHSMLQFQDIFICLLKNIFKEKYFIYFVLGKYSKNIMDLGKTNKNTEGSVCFIHHYTSFAFLIVIETFNLYFL